MHTHTHSHYGFSRITEILFTRLRNYRTYWSHHLAAVVITLLLVLAGSLIGLSAVARPSNSVMSLRFWCQPSANCIYVHTYTYIVRCTCVVFYYLPRVMTKIIVFNLVSSFDFVCKSLFLCFEPLRSTIVVHRICRPSSLDDNMKNCLLYS